MFIIHECLPVLSVWVLIPFVFQEKYGKYVE